MKPFDIYHADHYWRTRNYAGFFLLIKPEGTNWLCFGIATEDPNFEAIELNESHPDFPATGLKHTSHVYDGDPYSRIPIVKLGTRKGELQGELLSYFRQKTGL